MSSNEDANRKIGGRLKKDVWKHFIKGNEKAPEHYKATCKACMKFWTRGEPAIMEEYLANHCIQAEPSEIHEYLNITANRNINDDSQRKQKSKAVYGTMDAFLGPVKLPKGKVERIDRALVKAFTCAGISWRIIEHPFFKDLLKELNSAYESPTREHLAERLLEKEMSIVNNKINRNLEQQENLTLYKYIYFLFYQNQKNIIYFNIILF